MSRPSRSIPDFDYKILGNSGGRVHKVRTRTTADDAPVASMATENLDDLPKLAIEIRSDVEDLFESYDVDELSDEEELSSYQSKLEVAKRNFRRIHAQLKANEGDEGFQEKYPYYDTELGSLNDKFKIVTKKLTQARKKSKSEVNNLETQFAEAQAEREKSKCIALRKCFLTQAQWDIDNCTWDDLEDPDEIKNAISKFEKHSETLLRICGDLEFLFGDNLDGELRLANCETMDTLRAKIKLGSERLALIKKNIIEKTEEVKLLAEASRKEQEKAVEAQKLKDLLACSGSLVSEIDTRSQLFVSKCSVDLSTLNDYEVLEIKKGIENMHVELRELIDKVSCFETFVLPCGESAQGLRDKVSKLRDGCRDKMTEFSKNLDKAISTRDISEKKLKNSATLDIEMKKFKGYGSEDDYYTFKSEFKKLVEPVVQKTFWADYLKKNCLSGAALNLVRKIDDIEEIWKKLKEAYGNTHLMLQSKLGSLEKFTNLDKLKDDEKIANHIAGLLNLMAELGKLAEEYKLENDLYHGVGLHKIMNFMGKQRQRKFIKTVATQDIGGKVKWSKLIDFLKGELKEREAFVLHDKVVQSSLGEYKEKPPRDNSRDENQKNPKDSFMSNPGNEPPKPVACSLCGKTVDHVLSYTDDKKPYIEYIACKMFVEMNCQQRDNLLFKKKFCNKCLTPGVKYGSNHVCDKQYACGQPFTHKNGTEMTCEKHVLVCKHHCKEPSNVSLLDSYKKLMIKPAKKFFDFTKQISISCYARAHVSKTEDVGDECDENDDDDPDPASIYLFQTLMIACGFLLNMFYDGGCGDALISKEAVDQLMSIGRATLHLAGPLFLEGVNNQQSVSKHGVYEITLPLKNGEEAKMTALCLDQITTPFPKYPLSKVESDIQSYVKSHEPDLLPRLPKLSEEVGGKVHFMIGKHYLKHFPREITRLDTGLTLYESMFKSYDDTIGVVSGPHPQFTKVHRTAHFAFDRRLSYYTQEALPYIKLSSPLSSLRSVPVIGPKEPLADTDLVKLFPGDSCTREEVISPNLHSTSLSLKDEGVACPFGDSFPGAKGLEMTNSYKVYVTKRGPKCLKKFEEMENAGTVISYRCMDCRNCKKCLSDGLVEEISIKKEAEQHLINKNVTVNLEEGYCETKLPFLADPDTRLVSNEYIARKIYNSQVKILSKSEKDRKDTLESEKKLQDLGYVEWLENVDVEVRNSIISSAVRYLIPWRVVFSDSLSTPVRTVFDGSSKTDSGNSLNDLLPGGTNNMNPLLEIILRWSIQVYGYHTDVRKMYNSVRMNQDFWRFQLYWWSDTLTEGEEPRLKVIKTVIYGIKCSGNQAERALRLAVEMQKDKYPLAYKIVMNDVYVDDCISGELTDEERSQATDEFKLALEKVGFTLKGITLSGSDPDESLSKDGKYIMVGGFRWFPKEDFYMLNIGKINFARKKRGRKVDEEFEIPEILTKKICVSVSAEVFDPPGKTVPITAGIKVDISDLHRLGLGWDDQLPENLRSVWKNNFEMIQELGSLKYKRVIVPADAKNLDIFTIDTADASLRLICAAIYARFELKDGSFSCQLVFARSKIVPEGTSTPRSEAMAAAMNAATGFTVQKAFGKYHKRHLKLTDSTVTLHWIASDKVVLKQFVRGLVVEVQRLTDKTDWRHIDGSNMPADLGTRRGVKIADIAQDSDWINGLPWMNGPEEDFPTSSIEDIRLNQQEIAEANKEKIVLRTFFCHRTAAFATSSNEQTKLRYEHSKYLIDPNKFRFRKVVRVLSLVLMFIKKISGNVTHILQNKIFTHKGPNDFPDVLKSVSDKFLVTSQRDPLPHTKCQSGLVVVIDDEMLKAAFNYYIMKASAEMTKFLDSKKYVNISKDVDGVFYYSGRILPDQKFQGYPELCEAALDLCKTSFCVPMMDQYSPTAISLALEIHWYHADVRHRGIEALCRQVDRVAHIIGGHNLMVRIKDGCKRCRVLNKKSIEVAMGPVHDVNLCIAPAFYASQVDITGPYKCYSPANKRATLKVWFVVFCCCTTGATSIRIMEDYSTDSFIQGFIRFSCSYGYPRYLLPDAGSQLLKGCVDAEYSYVDVKQRLSVEYGVEYAPCPVGAHYIHGRVERKIQEIKKSVQICVNNEKLSVVQWETLMAQISNSINNMPIGLKHRSTNLETLDLLTPNRLLLGRNNDRCPNKPLVICPDHKRMIETNADIFRAWFNAWIECYVPTLIERPKWFKGHGDVQVGDVVLFLKSEKEFDLQYQYGIIVDLHKSRDNNIRKVDIEYQNSNEGVKRTTHRGVREIVSIYPVDELDIYEELYDLFYYDE